MTSCPKNLSYATATISQPWLQNDMESSESIDIADTWVFKLPTTTLESLPRLSEHLLTAHLIVSPSPQQGPSSPMAPTSLKLSFLSSPSKLPIPTTNELYHTSIMPPRTPSPPPGDSQPMPLRYPETLGTVIEVRESEGKGLGVFAVHDGMKSPELRIPDLVEILNLPP
jgi:hypothetical protein